MTEKERIEVLEYAKKYLKKTHQCCICPAIDQSLMDVASLQYLSGMFTNYNRRLSRIFPELRRRKPKGRKWGQIWWNEGTDKKDKIFRLKVLNSMITEIKANSND